MPGYSKVPDFVRALVARSSSDTFYVGRTKSYLVSEIAEGALAHLGVQWRDGAAVYERAVVPPAERGRRWSNYNVNGRVVVRRDLPKAPKTVGGWEVPNFGDWKKGSHVHSATIMAYPRETWFAQRLPIVIDVAERVGDVVPVGFRVDRVFDRTDLVERDLHLACSLLRESVGGHVSVVPTDVSVADWLADQRVTWEFLPRGEATFERVVSRLRVDPSDPRVREAGERFVAIDSMRPGAVVVGDGEFSRYFGFKFREDLVALECLDYGNALYLMYEDWQVLGQRTRIDLLADENADYDRVVHRKGWQDRLRALLALRGHAVDGG